ncbi:reticulon-like protein B14 isoform X3 [Cucurbita moschata]|uniref:Reticulon-like protein n=1 Tax=Cucurbita moschata TaxID=3662 RepID=A0A6J1G247_CUCMO|nr:reticulon-like protein B14 isoform X3 [Cucurbita moschata]
MKECESKRILTRKQCSMAKCSVLICRNEGRGPTNGNTALACLPGVHRTCNKVSDSTIPTNIIMSNSGDRPRFLHSIFGHGKVAELMLWKKKRESAAMLAGISGVWLLLEVLDYHFVTLLCYLLIITMLLLFSWNKLALLVNWAPPNVHDFEISNATFTRFFDTVNWLVHHFFQISTGQNFKLFAMVMGSIWLVSLIGELTNSLNLIYIVFLSLQTVPIVLDKYEEEIHKLVSNLKSSMDTFFHTLHSNFLTKIPRRTHIKQT